MQSIFLNLSTVSSSVPQCLGAASWCQSILSLNHQRGFKLEMTFWSYISLLIFAEQNTLAAPAYARTCKREVRQGFRVKQTSNVIWNATLSNWLTPSPFVYQWPINHSLNSIYIFHLGFKMQFVYHWDNHTLSDQPLNKYLGFWICLQKRNQNISI